MNGRAHVMKAFYNLPTMAFGRRWKIKMVHRRMSISKNAHHVLCPSEQCPSGTLPIIFFTLTFLISLYTSPLSTLIGKHKGVNFHFYADDTQLFVHLSHMNASAAFDKLNRCLQDVKEWMPSSKLKQNPDKTEFILFGSKKQRERLNACFPIDILRNPLHPTESVRNLGVWFD